MQSTAAAAGVRLEHQVQSVIVYADPVRLHQVVTNLLSNAVKFGGAGTSATVDVFQEADTAVVVVADDGPGIRADDLPHVFDRFWRGDPGAGPTGTGLGLAIAHDLVAAHDGTVQIDSDVGVGTRITVRLPLGR
jgi:signal transduction histidine kinase